MKQPPPTDDQSLPAMASLWGPLLALQFLTVLPVPMLRKRQSVSGAALDMSSALPWFPAVGAAIGAGLALIDWVLTPILALPVRNVLLLAFSALVTGMLHLDGFVDSCDALLGTRSIEQRLTILRDSRVGAYGALGGTLLLLARFAALGELSGPTRVLALVVAPALGRWGMVYAITRFPYARQQGAGTAFRAKTMHLVAATIALLVVLLVMILLLAPPVLLQTSVLLILLALLAFVITLSWATWASKRLGGGLTGDTYGALNELIELAILILIPVLTRLVTHVPPAL